MKLVDASEQPGGTEATADLGAARTDAAYGAENGGVA